MPVRHAAAERLNVPILRVAVDWPYVLMWRAGVERQSVPGQRVAVRRLYVPPWRLRKEGLCVLGRGSLPRSHGGLPRWPGGTLGGAPWQGNTGGELGGTGGSLFVLGVLAAWRGQLPGVLGERRHKVAGGIAETPGRLSMWMAGLLSTGGASSCSSGRS